MIKTICVQLDKSEKYLDKRRMIKNDWGTKWAVDYFKVVRIKRSGKSVDIQYYKLIDKGFDREHKQTIYNHVPIMTKLKKVKYSDGEMFVSIYGCDYCIGTYPAKEV